MRRANATQHDNNSNDDVDESSKVVLYDLLVVPIHMYAAPYCICVIVTAFDCIVVHLDEHSSSSEQGAAQNRSVFFDECMYTKRLFKSL